MYPSLEYFTTIISSMYRQGMGYATYSPKVSVNPISVMGSVMGLFTCGKILVIGIGFADTKGHILTRYTG